MEAETSKAIARLEARIRELEAKLAMASMPDEAQALLDDLQMELAPGEAERVSLDSVEAFLQDMGYQTRRFEEFRLISFTDMFRDYTVQLMSDGSAEMVLGEGLDPDADRNLLLLLTTLCDTDVSISLNLKKELIEFSVGSIELDPDSYRSTIRFYINLLDEASKNLCRHYAALSESQRKGDRSRMPS